MFGAAGAVTHPGTRPAPLGSLRCVALTRLSWAEPTGSPPRTGRRGGSAVHDGGKVLGGDAAGLRGAVHVSLEVIAAMLAGEEHVADGEDLVSRDGRELADAEGRVAG